MRFCSIAVLAIAGVTVGCTTTETWTPPMEEAFTFEANDGQSVEALRGEFFVLENRADPDSRQIKLSYVKFPATSDNPGAPIVYLAGGPGGSGSGTAKGRRFPLFMAMREFGDVIAFDQRGTGASDKPPECVTSVYLPQDRTLPRDESLSLLKQSVAECEAFWKGEGVDISGYTTLESARDLDVLRAHLGADKISLWGISYGTHLSLAAVKEMGPRIDKLVMASAEGLDQTVKMPARTDAYFARLQNVINGDEQARQIFPDVAGMMRGVKATLDAEPVMMSLTNRKGEDAAYLLTGESMQLLASGMISDPESAVQMLWLYMAAYAGEFDQIEAVLNQFAQYGYLDVGEPLSWRAMPLAMDVASGISDERLAQVSEEAKTALVGDLLNFPMPHLRGAMGLDLGEEFRAAPQSDIPTLLLSGTLDGRTYPESQREAFGGFSNLSTVVVENAGHNLFMVSPEVTDTILKFMRGSDVDGKTITIEPPSFAPPGD